MADTSGLERSIQNWAKLVHHQTVLSLADELTQTVPVRTGFLRDSQEVVQRDDETWEIRYPVEYASWLDEGTDPHPIEGNPLLAFFWEAIGEFVIVPHVDHPGTEATEWWSSVMSEENYADVLNEVAQDFGLV